MNKIPKYVAAKEANGGRDLFGPAGSPHFEIDFVLAHHPVVASAQPHYLAPFVGFLPSVSSLVTC